MTLMWKEIQEQPETIERCARENEEKLTHLTEEIARRNIRTIIIAARGTSDHAAVYGKYAFEILTGIPTVLAAPSVFTIYGKTVRMEDSLVIGISQSGKASDVAEVLKAANEEKAVTVSITNDPESPLAKLAGFHLCCDAGTEKSVAATKTFTSELFLIGSLAVRLSRDEKLMRDFAEIPRLLRETLKAAPEIETVVRKYRFIKDCLILSRGINYCVALEAALKIQETSYIRAKAFATSDFYHGPMAMLEKDMPVIIFAPSGESLSDALEITQKAKDAGCDILMISDKEDVCRLGDSSIRIPGAPCEFVTPFLNAAIAQMFACSLSLLRKLNPDAPRMLHKVTVTL